MLHTTVIVGNNHNSGLLQSLSKLETLNGGVVCRQAFSSGPFFQRTLKKGHDLGSLRRGTRAHVMTVRLLTPKVIRTFTPTRSAFYTSYALFNGSFI